MNHETRNAFGKPTLDAESFQRLLAAAYILQSRGERAPVLPISAIHTNSFTTTAIVQKRISPVRVSSTQSGARSEANLIHKLAGPLVWKRIEALAIAIVFCMMMGMSIHRLLASSGRASQVPGILETRDAGPLPSPAPKVLTLSQQNATAQESIGDDLVIHYRAPTAATRTTSTSGTRIAISRQAKLAASRVVQYGDDVTMWSSGESSPGQSSLAQSRKSLLNR